MIVIRLLRKNQKGIYYDAWRKELFVNEEIEIYDTKDARILFRKYGETVK